MYNGGVQGIQAAAPPNLPVNFCTLFRVHVFFWGQANTSFRFPLLLLDHLLRPWFSLLP